MSVRFVVLGIFLRISSKCAYTTSWAGVGFERAYANVHIDKCQSHRGFGCTPGVRWKFGVRTFDKWGPVCFGFFKEFLCESFHEGCYWCCKIVLCKTGVIEFSWNSNRLFMLKFLI